MRLEVRRDSDLSKFCVVFFLHEDTLGAAAGAVIRIAHVHLALWCATSIWAAAGWVRGHFLVVPADLADEVIEGGLDVDARLGGSFEELAAELTGERFALCCGC